MPAKHPVSLRHEFYMLNMMGNWKPIKLATQVLLYYEETPIYTSWISMLLRTGWVRVFSWHPTSVTPCWWHFSLLTTVVKITSTRDLSPQTFGRYNSNCWWKNSLHQVTFSHLPNFYGIRFIYPQWRWRKKKLKATSTNKQLNPNLNSSYSVARIFF